MSDTAIANAREELGLPGQTRERARQVRYAIYETLKASISGALLLKWWTAYIRQMMGRDGSVKPKRRRIRNLRADGNLGWHKPVTKPPAEMIIKGMDRARLITMTAAQVAKKVRTSKVKCKADWAAKVMRDNHIPFIDSAPTCTRYPWHIVAPLEWWLLTDEEQAAKIECTNVSVVAQYRERHNKLGKYLDPDPWKPCERCTGKWPGCTHCKRSGKVPRYSEVERRGIIGLTILRRYFRRLSPKRRLRLVKRWMAGDRAGVRRLAAKDLQVARAKMRSAERFMESAQWRLTAMPHNRVAKRRLTRASARLERARARVAECRIDEAMRRFLVMVRVKFPTENLFPLDVVRMAEKTPTTAPTESHIAERV